jgi:hypothetical protein
MPTPTYIPLSTITLGSAASSITFGSIPQGYRDLVVIIQGTLGSTAGFGLRFNGDTGSNYSYVGMDGYGSSTNSYSGTDTSMPAGVFLSTGGVSISQIMDYSATDKQKTTLHRRSAGGWGASAIAGRWANTNAITSVTAMGVTFTTGSTFSLYGIAG